VWSSNIFLRAKSERENGVSGKPNGREAESRDATTTKSKADVRLIDFQFSRWGHPAGDLAYFRATTLRPDFWAERGNREAFFRKYLEYLLKASDLLGICDNKGNAPQVLLRSYSEDDFKADYR
jgi:hypothetical protein